MPDPVTGITAATAIGGAALSAKGASDAASDAADARNASLSFDRQRYADWQATYGSLQDNLADYYEGLTPAGYITRNSEALDKEYEAAQTQLRESLAQRGIRPDSGVAVAIDAGLELGRAEKRAEVRATAEEQVNKQKQGFLALGLGANPADTVSANNRAVYQNASRDASQASAAAGQAVGTAVSEVGTALSDYFRGE